MKYIKNETILDILERGTSDEISDIIEYLLKSKNNITLFKSKDLYKNLTNDNIRFLQDKVNWYHISLKEKLSEEFIREFQDKVDWDNISICQKLSESFIREFQDKVDWDCISSCQKLSESFIREFQNKVDWDNISSRQILSEDFIREFQDKFYWGWISMYQNLSESFIREFKDKLNWSVVTRYQLLSEEFIREFQDKVDWDSIFKYQIVSRVLLKEFINRCKLKKYDISNLDNLDRHTLIKNFQEVTIYNNDIYGYKVLDSDNRSIFYGKLYELNKETEKVNCDISNITCSFGYNFYLRLEDIDYNGQRDKIIKVLVKKEDIGVILDDENIGRCYKLTPVQFIK